MFRSRTASVSFILITILINVMGLGLIIPVLPKLIEQLAGGVQAGAFYNGIFIAIYAAMQFIFAPILGVLSDRYGRRPVLLLSLVGTVLDYLVAALAQSLLLLLITRIVAGIMGASFSTANAYIADVSKPEERARNFGLIGAVFGLGFILGPALGGLLGNTDLRLPFYFAAGVAFLNLLYGYFVLPESLKPEHRNTRGRALFSNPFASFGVLTKIPLVRGMSLSVLLVNMAFSILQSIWVLYTTYRFGWNVQQTGLSLMLVGLVSTIVQGGLVRLVVERLGERRSVVLGQGVGVATFTLYGLASQGWMMYATILLGGLGQVSAPASQSLISKSISPREQGAVQGALAALVSLTGIVGPLLGNFVFGQFARPEAAPWLVGMPFFIGAVLYAAGLFNTIVTFRRVSEEAPHLAAKEEVSS